MTVSVIIAVYNASAFLKEAIDSMLRQSFTDWEILAIDDCSTDNSLEILHSYKDDRIRIICNKENSGSAFTRNVGLKLANGKYIAILDADDVAFPQRLEAQVQYLEANPEIGLLGSWAKAINQNGDFIYDIITPVSPDKLRTRLLFESALVHSSLMIRRDLVHRYHLYYNDKFRYAQDFELLSRASLRTSIANLSEFLVYYRVSPQNVSSMHYEKQSRFAMQCIGNLYSSLGICATHEQLDVLYSMLYEYKPQQRNQRVSLLVLFFKLFNFCISHDEYSISMLGYYFNRLYKLACAGKGRKLRYFMTIFDLLPLLVKEGVHSPVCYLRFVRFYIMYLLG